MFIQMGTMVVVTLVIMFSFSIVTTFLAVILILPGAMVGPVYGSYNREAVRMMQAAKAKANALAEERIGNVRTVKAFSDEDHSAAAFKDLCEDVYKVALYKGRIWGTFMFCM
jgi:ATP-binding cassette, subfamily B (MDR/TAP), member 10